MSKQSKKRKRRHERQKRQQRDKLINIFNSLYPNAPAGSAITIVEDYLRRQQAQAQMQASNTETIKQATLTYVRQHATDFGHAVEHYIDAVLQGIESGVIYTEKTPQILEDEANLQAKSIIEGWRIR